MADCPPFRFLPNGAVVLSMAARVEGMASPVRCTCGAFYDLQAVSDIVARHTDCTVWNAPCCGRRAHDGWFPEGYQQVDADGFVVPRG